MNDMTIDEAEAKAQELIKWCNDHEVSYAICFSKIIRAKSDTDHSYVAQTAMASFRSAPETFSIAHAFGGALTHVYNQHGDDIIGQIGGFITTALEEVGAVFQPSETKQ